MAKSKKNEEEVGGFPEAPEAETQTEGAGGFDVQDEVEDPMVEVADDFSVEDEYKPDPLCSAGNYYGNVTAVGIVNNSIAFSVTLEGNGGFMNDGETPIDGATYIHNIWLPKHGDEDIPDKSGRRTKRQSKINMMAKASEDMKLDFNSLKSISTNIEEANWIGHRVIVELGLNTYQGRISNRIQRARAVE